MRFIIMQKGLIRVEMKIESELADCKYKIDVKRVKAKNDFAT
ncbi:hypothetical protein [Oceanirhabdus sp. W0125-5]|nr:hypothetical protein [Oceanirhabdus sp. W0125-5]WBW95269.1 hypothetical protein OW730_16425 [Oceanirhabdus sp. W0125-5]